MLIRLRKTWFEIVCKLCNKENHQLDYHGNLRLNKRLGEKELYCHYCKRLCLINEFTKSGLKPKYPRCKVCASNFAKKYHRKYAVLKRYGITLEQHQKMMDEQNNLCAICNQRETRKNGYNADDARLCIDHDHKTGKIRKLLCSECNTGLGKFKDSPSLLKKAADYLDFHEKAP